MRPVIRAALTLLPCMGVAAVAAAQAAAPPTAEAPAARPVVKKEPVLWAASELKWTDVVELKGAQQAVLWGEPDKKGYGKLNKWPAGLEVPLHWHTFENRVVVLSGTMVITMDGGQAKELPAGSYMSMPGRARHTTSCKVGSDCVFFSEGNLRFDVKIVEPPKK